MKKLSFKISAFIFAGVLVISSCSKKQYSGFFNNSSNSYAHSSKSKPDSKSEDLNQSENVALIEASSTNSEMVLLPTENQKVSASLAKAANVSTSQSSKKASSAPKLTLKEKLALKKIMKAEKTNGGDNQIIAAILAFAVGGLGVHRFYLGYIWQGVVQLLTAGGCGIWALIDFIRILIGDLKPKDGSYSKTF
jgi:TM2 domain-containing membrane protein YozV